MRNRLLLPRLAGTAIRKNGAAYFPYILTCGFSAAVYFILMSITRNPVLDPVPHVDYLRVLMAIGTALLSIILAPFLIAANSFLLKRRKRELGLYSILGMEKKHIGFLLFMETALVYAVSMAAGIISALLFSKLLFMVLMRISGMEVEASFYLDLDCVKYTLIYFGAVAAVNLFLSLFNVSLVNPVELFKSGRKGEKEIRHAWIPGLLGLALLSGGYAAAIRARVDSDIFINFFLAVSLVVGGTYFLFTSGSVVALRMMKKNKSFYYQSDNFVTVSGMLYRMKKSASDLVGICIFSTMVMITLICTVTLFRGEEEALRFSYYYDVSCEFLTDQLQDPEAVTADIRREAAARHVDITQMKEIPYRIVFIRKTGDVMEYNSGRRYGRGAYGLRLMTLADYNRIENARETLEEGEVLLYSSAADYGYPELTLAGDRLRVKRELKKISFEPKEERSMSHDTLYLVLKDSRTVEDYAARLHSGPEDSLYSVLFQMQGGAEDKEALVRTLESGLSGVPGYHGMSNILDGRKSLYAMNGGLLFIGLFFGIVFMVCVALMIYYKQISEGYEDQNSFAVMKKVGMSAQDIRKTIRRQIQTVFFLPFAGAAVHTLIGVRMVIALMGVLNIYRESLVYTSAAIVMACFGIFYMVSYFFTAGSYYKIVR